MLENLASNAIKFTPDGGSIELRAWRTTPRRAWCLSMVDDGIGIAPEDQARIFERFVQVDSTSTRAQHNGSGLGLALVREYGDMQGFAVSIRKASSVVAAGSSSRFRERDRGRDRGGRWQGHGHRRRGQPAASARQLVSNGYAFCGARDAESGLELLASEHPDLLLLDVMLPGTNGFDLCAHPRAGPPHPGDLPVCEVRHRGQEHRLPAPAATTT